MSSTGRVPLLDENDRFPDRFAPPSVAADAAAAEAARAGSVAAASDATAAKTGAETARDESVAAAVRAEAVPAQVDTAMADQVGTGGEFDTKLNATIETVATPLAAAAVGTLATPQTPTLNSLATAARGKMPSIVTLVAGSDDERAASSVANGTVTLDTTNYKLGGQAIKVQNNIGQRFVTWTVPLPSNPSALPAWQALSMWVYIDDPTKFANITLLIYPTSSLAIADRLEYITPSADLVAGWNFLRIPAGKGGIVTDILYRQAVEGLFQVDIRTVLVDGHQTAQHSMTFGHIYLECPPKARFLHIADRGYKTFLEGIYPDMKARGWPITMAVDALLYGSQSGTIWEAMTKAQMKALAAENGNSISFHGYSGAPTSGMTVEELREDTVNSLKHLQQEYPESMGRLWRAAYVQGTAPQWESTRDYLLASASGRHAAGHGPTAWPPSDLHDIPRISLDSHKTETVIDRWFTHAKNTHMTYLIFVHGLSSYEWDVPQAKWEQYRDNLDAAIAEGWAETVTFEQLFLEAGGSFSTIGGGILAEYTEADGTRVAKTVL